MPTGALYNSVWFQVTAGENSDAYFGATWTSSLDCVLVGRQFFDGVIVYSQDRGVSWSRTLQSGYPLTDVASFVSYSTYFLISTSTSGDIFVSSDNGITWTSVVTLSSSLYSVSIGLNGKSVGSVLVLMINSFDFVCVKVVRLWGELLVLSIIQRMQQLMPIGLS
jgi:photosystem II stability/assembly factor-like uncharacterized protein